MHATSWNCQIIKLREKLRILLLQLFYTASPDKKIGLPQLWLSQDFICRPPQCKIWFHLIEGGKHTTIDVYGSRILSKCNIFTDLIDQPPTPTSQAAGHLMCLCRWWPLSSSCVHQLQITIGVLGLLPDLANGSHGRANYLLRPLRVESVPNQFSKKI